MSLLITQLRAAIIVVVFALTIPAILFAADLSKGEKDTIFIGELKVQPAVIEGARHAGRNHELSRVAETLDTQFINALNGTRVFQLVDRKRFSDLKLEQDFAQSGNVDQDDKNAAKSGKMAGAKFAFLPQLDSFEDKSEISEYQKIGRADMKRKLYLSVTVQVIDTTTGKLLPDSPSVQLNREELVEGGRIGQVSGSEEAIVEIAKEMAQKLSQELVSLLRPAKILSITGKQIMINRGTEAGFHMNDLVEIYAFQDVKDEDTGEVYRNEVPVGQATIVRIDKNSAMRKSTGTIWESPKAVLLVP